MDFNDTLSGIRRDMREQSIDLLLGFHDGVHFIEKPNAVMVLTGFKSLGHAMVILPRDGAATLVVTPPWDAERAAERCPSMHSIGTDKIVNALAAYLERHHVPSSGVGTAGLAGMPLGYQRASERDVTWGSAAGGQDGIWQRATKNPGAIEQGPHGNANRGKGL